MEAVPKTPAEVAIAELQERYPDKNCAGAVLVGTVETVNRNVEGKVLSTVRERKFRLADGQCLPLPGK